MCASWLCGVCEGGGRERLHVCIMTVRERETACVHHDCERESVCERERLCMCAS